MTTMKALVVFVLCLLSWAAAKPTGKNIAKSAVDLEALVKENGYPFESYEVHTEDKYILTVHRIPHGIHNKNGTNKPVVFLQHGLLCSSADWIIMGPNRGLAYLLADLGYDVWLGNVRGNTYSRKHETKDPDKDHSYWAFSWHEMGIYDLPTMIDKALQITKQDKLSYIGHSQGTTIFFVMASTRPAYNDKIRVMIALAPVAFMKHIPNLAIKLIATLDFAGIEDLLGSFEFLPSNAFLELIGQALCKDTAPFQALCEDVLFLIAGFDSKELNATTIPAILTDTPAGASTTQLIHYSQGIDTGYFRQFDYGIVKNLWKYGSIHPPDYKIKQITTPVALLFGDNDLLTAVQDIYKLHDELPNNVYMEQVPYTAFTHLDFLWAIDVKKLVYNEVFDLLKKFK